MIAIKNLSKTYRVHQKDPGLMGSLRSLVHRRWQNKSAVAGINLDINENEIVGLIGANGAGKTTLIKMLSGIIYPSSGSANVLGFIPWQRKNEFRRQISLIMGQKAQLWWDLPAADCMLLLREIYQIPHKIYAERLERLTEMLKVREVLKIQIRRLSLGERMKMELIAALLHGPKVVYLDEPTIGLDFNAQKAIRDFILEYRREHRPAMILTSHYMEDIERLCERVVILREGAIVYDGTLQNIVNKYAKYKIVTAVTSRDLSSLAAGNDYASIAPGFKDGMATVLQASENQIKLRVMRSHVPDLVSSLLKIFTTADLSIVEDDISMVIASIFRDQDQVPHA